MSLCLFIGLAELVFLPRKLHRMFCDGDHGQVIQTRFWQKKRGLVWKRFHDKFTSAPGMLGGY